MTMSYSTFPPIRISLVDMFARLQLPGVSKEESPSAQILQRKRRWRLPARYRQRQR